MFYSFSFYELRNCYYVDFSTLISVTALLIGAKSILSRIIYESARSKGRRQTNLCVSYMMINKQSRLVL